MSEDAHEPAPYLHGYSEAERQRLRKQARFAEHMVHRDVNLTGVKRLLEVGCGVGAQSEIILRRFPEIHIVGVDRNVEQLASARSYLESLSFAAGRFELREEDATQLSFDTGTFDGAFLCWILEHVSDPTAVLSEVRRVSSPGARVWVTEVMNSSFFIDPYSPATWKYWMAFNDHQYESGGDPFVGAKLGNLFLATGYRDIVTEVKTFHLDNRQPGDRRSMIAYWTELLISAADQLLEAGRVDKALVAEVERELDQVSRNPHAVFFYSFMQASARVI